MKRIISTIVGIILIVIAAIILTHVYLRYVVGPPPTSQTTVTLPEGSSVYDEDRILSDYGVIKPGQLIIAAGVGPSSTASTSLEGRLFPDTYDFYLDSSSSVVIGKMLDDFNTKAAPLLASSSDPEQTLIIASILEKEVASSTDQAIVAGIIEKRLATDIPLDIDATICYIKEMQIAQGELQARDSSSTSVTSDFGCYPLSASDFKIDSPYNTYLYKGLPPTPISNPGVAAIQAALNPVASPYLYYLSDPKTGATIYAKTLAEQNANRKKYLGE